MCGRICHPYLWVLAPCAMQFCSGFATTLETNRSNRILLSGCWTRSILYTARRCWAVRRIRWSLWRRIDRAPGSPQRHNCVARPRDTRRCISATVGPRNGPAAVKSTTRDSPLRGPFSSWFSPVGAPGARGRTLLLALLVVEAIWFHPMGGRQGPAKPGASSLNFFCTTFGCEGIHP